MNFDGYKKEFKISKWHCIEPLVYLESERIKKGFKINPDSLVNDIDVLSAKASWKKDGMPTDNFFIGLHDNISVLYLEPLKSVLHELENIINSITQNDWQITKSWSVSYNRGSFIWPHEHTLWDAGSNKLDNTLSGVVCLTSSPGDGTLRFEDDTYYDQIQGDVLLFDSKLVHWCDVIRDPKVVISFDIAIKEPV